MPLSYLAPPDDDVMEPEDEEQINDLAAQDLRDVPALRASPAPQGYVPVGAGGTMVSDADVAPIGDEPKPVGPTFPVIRHASAPDSKPYQNVPDFVAERKEQIPVPVVKSSIGAPTDVAPMPLDRLGPTDLPTRGALPAPAKRIIGQDKTLPGAQETARQFAATMPVRPVPKWWERALAGVAGGAIGFSNAAGRAREIDPTKVTDNILYPGYDQKLASWQSGMDKANKQVENLGQQVGAEYAAQKAQSDAQLKAAQAAMDIEHGDYWLKRSEQERNQWKFNANGSVLNTITGQIVAPPPTPQARYNAALAITGGDKEKAQYYALNGKLPPPTQHNVSEWQSYLDANGGDSSAALRAKQADDVHKAIASRDPSMANYRNWEETQKEEAAVRAVTDKRNNTERQIQNSMATQITALTAGGRTKDPVREAEIRRSAAIALQNMQKEYADAIRAKGGSADEYDVDPVSLQWKPKATANPYAANPYRTSAPAAAPAPRRPLDGR